MWMGPLACSSHLSSLDRAQHHSCCLILGVSSQNSGTACMPLFLLVWVPSIETRPLLMRPKSRPEDRNSGCSQGISAKPFLPSFSRLIFGPQTQMPKNTRQEQVKPARYWHTKSHLYLWDFGPCLILPQSFYHIIMQRYLNYETMAKR